MKRVYWQPIDYKGRHYYAQHSYYLKNKIKFKIDF